MKDEKLYTPGELAKLCSINRNTLNRYLSYSRMFPPEKINEDTGYRYYGEETIKKFELFKHLRKKPFRLKISEIEKIYTESDFETICQKAKESRKILFEYLMGEDLL